MVIKKRKRIVLIGFAVLIAVSILVFVLSSLIIARKSNDAISQVGKVYTHAMAGQVKQTFDAVISMQVFQLQGLVERTPPESVTYGQQMIDDLIESARVRNFTYLALYTEEGEAEIIYGEPVDYYDENTFYRVLKNSNQRVFSGYDTNDNRMLCLLVDAQYPMHDGKTSSAIVAALPMEYLEEVLSLNDSNTDMYSFIIRRNGTYVVRNLDDDNYFDRILDIFSESDDKSRDTYIQELQTALNTDADYSTLIYNGDEYEYMLCTHLPDSEWYLVSIMPFGLLEDIVNDMNIQRQVIILTMAGVILVGIIIIFFIYYRLSQQQRSESVV